MVSDRSYVEEEKAYKDRSWGVKKIPGSYDFEVVMPEKDEKPVGEEGDVRKNDCREVLEGIHKKLVRVLSEQKKIMRGLEPGGVFERTDGRYDL